MNPGKSLWQTEYTLATHGQVKRAPSVPKSAVHRERSP